MCDRKTEEMEIEEIKARWDTAFPIDRQAHKDIKVLLSSLEKEEQAHVMSVYDLNMKIAELGVALEKEKELKEEMQKRVKICKLKIEQVEERVEELESKEVALKIVIDKFKKGSEGMGIAFTDAMNHEEQLEINLQKLVERILNLPVIQKKLEHTFEEGKIIVYFPKEFYEELKSLRK